MLRSGYNPSFLSSFVFLSLGEEAAVEELTLREEIVVLQAEGLSLKDIARSISERYGLSKRDVYALGIQLKAEKNRTLP